MKRDNYISVSGAGGIVADFVGTPTSGCAPLAVQFTDKSTGTPTMWSWDFGDGTTGGMVANPSHTYSVPGTYTVKLTASSQTGGSSSKVKEGYITVSQTGGIVADFVGTPTSGSAPLTVQFTDKSTGNPTMWSWDFGDGPIPMDSASCAGGNCGNIANPTHTYSAPGTYTVRLTASSQTGGSSTKVKEGYITVSQTGGIVADFVGTPTSGTAPLTVQFTDKSTGNPTMWSWDFGDGPIPMDSASCAGGNCGNIANPSHTYSAPGTYTVKLTASSQTGGSSTKVKEGYITVSPTGGIVADFVGTPTSGTAPLTVQFADKSTGNPTMWAWDFGDGPIPMDSASCAGGNCGNIANPTHTYSAPGTYTVRLTASSQTGGSSTKVKEGYITVTSTGSIIADFIVNPASGYAPMSVQFTDRSSGGPTMWSWDFGDGGHDSVGNPVHVYQTPGTYTVTLTASNSRSSNTIVKAGAVVVQPSGPGVPGRIKITYAPDRSQVYLNNALQGETKFLKTYTIEKPSAWEL